MDINEKRRQPLQDFPFWGLFLEVAAAAALFEILEYIVQRLIERRFQAFFHDPHYLGFKDRFLLFLFIFLLLAHLTFTSLLILTSGGLFRSSLSSCSWYTILLNEK